MKILNLYACIGGNRYKWAYKVLDCLEKNCIVSAPDKYGDRKIIVDEDFFDSEFLVVMV